MDNSYIIQHLEDFANSKVFTDNKDDSTQIVRSLLFGLLACLTHSNPKYIKNFIEFNISTCTEISIESTINYLNEKERLENDQ